MDFCEKLQALRKSREMTQEELAQALYVSRAAVSKWESGRGYPSIDSLRDISDFFSVSIDDLLSGEKLISIAANENKSNIRNMCDLLLSVADLFSVMLVVLPLYPDMVDGFVCSVSLIDYTQGSEFKRIIYWLLFAALIVTGIIKAVLTKIKSEKLNKALTCISVITNIIAVLFLAVAREAYAIVIAFLILMVKMIILSKYPRE
ncbi:MAG: helix-turn-helix transcriptional regulator [Clostridia bacterium]|nr:helix-turn-helix transcriptional regulator [Clostridia bacterium]